MTSRDEGEWGTTSCAQEKKWVRKIKHICIILIMETRNHPIQRSENIEKIGLIVKVQARNLTDRSVKTSRKPERSSSRTEGGRHIRESIFCDLLTTKANPEDSLALRPGGGVIS